MVKRDQAPTASIAIKLIILKCKILLGKLHIDGDKEILNNCNHTSKDKSLHYIMPF